ncbi:MAG: carboxypeptidase regulatory-like domain-containing protein [Acidobacteria bacterium]|nr:carboxypeptidase regulatory-like domain-containing protein [Acidobacteriota bacterium]MCA1649830.1 carboxypeptidase regulatory-like domain-containing protein [Acidobacteriota bacterium]
MGSFRALAAVLLALSATTASAQGRIAGTIKDEAGRPLKGATITAHNADHSPSTYSASTDQRGRFGMLGLRRGVWTISIQCPGYEPVQSQIDVQTLRPNRPVEVRLIKGLEPVPAGPLERLSAKDIQQRIDAAEAKATSGDIDAAVIAYRDILTGVPAMTSIYLRLGALHERKSDPAAALAAYRELVRLEPSNDRALAAIQRLGG